MAVKIQVTTPTDKHKWFGKRPGLFISNNRFYILVFSLLLSLLVVTYFRTSITSDTLYVIRVEQAYGFLAVAFWYIALLATPLGSVFGKQGRMRHYLHARRALGVSAAYFTTLHMLFSVFGQLGGISNIFLLPSRFQQALWFGLVGLVVLLLMAATSFDSVIKWMTFPRWKWLHRAGYIAAIFVFLHIWMIGTHTGYSWVRWSLFFALVVLAGLEAWRISLQTHKRFTKLNQTITLGIFISLFVGFVAIIIALPNSVDGYHEQHHGTEAHR